MITLPESSRPGFPELMRAAEKQLVNPEAEYRAALTNPALAEAQRFSALYGLLHRLRREARFPEYVELVHRYESDFSAQPYFDTFRVVSAQWLADNPRLLREALAPADRAVKAFPDEPGVLHQYAELIVTLAEVDPSTGKKTIQKAEASVNKAIALSSVKNPNHFSTRARLMVLKKDYRSARSDVAIAISLENPASPDFLRRTSRYEGIRSMIAIHQANDEFAYAQRKLLEELNGFRREQLQMLGILAAVIALIVGATTLTTRVAPSAAGHLILLSTGAVSLVFGGLAGLLARAHWGRVVLTLVIGVALMAAGWLAP